MDLIYRLSLISATNIRFFTIGTILCFAKSGCHIMFLVLWKLSGVMDVTPGDQHIDIFFRIGKAQHIHD